MEEKINEARVKELMGIQISDREIYTMDVLKENNLFVAHNQMISVDAVNYTYFFFDEEKCKAEQKRLENENALYILRKELCQFPLCV